MSLHIYAKIKNPILFQALLIAMSISFGSDVRAQSNYYGTAEGRVVLMGMYEEQIAVATSKKLIINLDYESAEIEMRLFPSTLSAINDSLNSYFSRSKDLEFFYRGKLGVDFINTTEHPTLSFEVLGSLIVGEYELLMPGSGMLLHFSDEGEIACLLEMEFFLSLSSEINLPFLADEDQQIQIRITEAVLRK